jgi:hypothetical protein
MAEIVQYLTDPQDWTPASREVKVIFRKWSDGTITALFPEIPNDHQGWSCVSYEHMGQHGGANCSRVMSATREASPEEYKHLLRELGQIGYTRLRIVKRMTRQMLKARRAWQPPPI